MSELRERKKERTREAIQREALRLIADQGYEATTCEQIAASAGVAPATLFRYFATKEDIVLRDVYDPMIAAAVRARPAAEEPLIAVRRGFAATLAQVCRADLEVVRRRTALILAVPALRARSREQQESLQVHLAVVLAERTGRSVDELGVQVAAAACTAAVVVAVQRWAHDGGDLPSHVDAALAAVGELTGRSWR